MVAVTVVLVAELEPMLKETVAVMVTAPGGVAEVKDRTVVVADVPLVLNDTPVDGVAVQVTDSKEVYPVKSAVST